MARLNHHRKQAPRGGRRAFLADVGMGFTGLALGELLLGDGVARAVDSAVAGSPRRRCVRARTGVQRRPGGA